MATYEELIQQFAAIASAPIRQLERYLEENKKVILCAPVYTPQEIIHSMGLLPFGAWGADMEIKEAKSYFPAFLCSIVQSILELGMTGAYKGVEAIVIPSLCDSLKCLGENWKYGVPSIPFIPMVYPQNRTKTYGVEFTKAGYERVIKDLEKITGATFNEDSLNQSIALYQKHNQVMKRFSDEASDCFFISATDRNTVFESALYMEISEHTELVERLLFVMESMEKPVIKKCRVITTGILSNAKELLSIFDENEMQIVADDIAQESRQYRTNYSTDKTGLQCVAEQFIDRKACSVLYEKEKSRQDYITTLAEEKKADGVIAVMTKFCDPEEFDYVLIKEACAKKDIPLLFIEVDRQMTNYGQVRTAVQTFKEIILA